ncbi:MAG: DUF4349 domain-containing protein [Clostridiales Family XIII bacterium]|jgi:Na+-transporting methylmalonyl-CoA/oxaloacetate decarboxylase gamma subunit|nr:DUF4349 domain-containing protein [Clostridiales Family XIII bacterium]
MKKKTIRFSVVLLLSVFMLSFAACGSGGSASEESEAGEAAATEAMSVAGDDGDVTYDSVAEESPVFLRDAKSPASMSEAEYVEAAKDSAGGSAGAGLPDSNRKITFSASFTVDTKAYDADYAKINQIVSDFGGYIASEETQAYPYQTEQTTGRSSYFSLRIPVKGYDSFLTKLEQIGEVANKNKSSDDLTAEYFDTEARIEMLEMRKVRLTEYIKSATKAADIVAFEKELSDVLLELDQYEGNKRRLDQLVDYASVDVTLEELITPETIGKDGEPLGSRASDAFSISVTGVGEFLQDAAVFLAGAAPVLVLLIVFLIIIWVIVKLIRRARAKYYEAHPEKKKKQKQVQYVPYTSPNQQPIQAPQQPQQPQQQKPPEQESQQQKP